MKFCVYSIYDLAANIYRRDFKLPERVDGRGEISHAEAVRSFAHGVQSDQKNDLNTHPSDYEMYFTGTYDDNTGFYENVDRVRVCRAIDFVKADVQV